MSRYKRWKNNNLNNRGIGQQHRHKNNNTNTTNINNNFMNLRGPKRRTSRKAWLCRATWCTAQHSQDCPGVGKLGENRRKKRGISKKQREELWDSLGCAELRCAQHSIAKNVSLVLKGICTTITRTRTTMTTTRTKTWEAQRAELRGNLDYAEPPSASHSDQPCEHPSIVNCTILFSLCLAISAFFICELTWMYWIFRW